MIHLFWLIIACRGKVNFENLGRQGKLNEGTYRNNFDKPFDFLRFNQELIDLVCEKELGIAFDPSFISKSGKQTAGLAYFWSGCAGRSKRGLEIAGFGAIDILNNTCMHLCAYQTVRHKEYNSLLHCYSDLVSSKAPELLKTSKYLVAGAYFSKKSFSMFSIKTQYFNEHMLDRFISAFGIFPIPKKNNPVYLKLRDFGKIAA